MPAAAKHSKTAAEQADLAAATMPREQPAAGGNAQRDLLMRDQCAIVSRARPVPPTIGFKIEDPVVSKHRSLDN